MSQGLSSSLKTLMCLVSHPSVVFVQNSLAWKNPLNQSDLMFNFVSATTSTTASINVRSKRDPSPSLRQPLLHKQDSKSNLNLSNAKSKIERTNSANKAVSRTNSQRDVTRSNSITRRESNRDSKRETSPAMTRSQMDKVFLDIF